ncbi:MAG: hypothetical protein HRT90_08455, partial [Candidatus Margulisbacteria bacterium]|nr:hypothetical protein [Candidatus Margulisiibacteriota bacterium]
MELNEAVGLFENDSPHVDDIKSFLLCLVGEEGWGNLEALGIENVFKELKSHVNTFIDTFKPLGFGEGFGF